MIALYKDRRHPVSGEENHPLPASAAEPQRRQPLTSYRHVDRERVDRLRTVLSPVEQPSGLAR